MLINDFNLDSYGKIMNGSSQNGDVNTLGMFVSVGLTKSDRTPKPALAVWDSFRK